MLNGVEYFIHHEDVRRANGRGRRTDRLDLDTVAWRTVGLTVRHVGRQVRPHGLTISSPDGKTRQIGPSRGAVLHGEPSELLVYLSGRRNAVEVTVEGEADAVTALRDARSAL